MKKTLWQRLLLPMFGMIAADVSHASPPSEKLVCTTAPRSAWMPEAKIREAFGEKDYTLVKFKVSRGNCYEFYAVHKDGGIVEAYFHPLSGEKMRFNRVSTSTAVPAYESRSGAQPAVKP